MRPLLDDPDPAVRRAAVHVAGVVLGSPAEILEQVAAADSGRGRRGIVAGALLTDGLADRLYGTGDEDVRAGLAANRGFPTGWSPPSPRMPPRRSGSRCPCGRS
ncbi:hypothetical protein [Streptomyces globisporus]